MAVHPFDFHWRENLMNPMSFHFVKSRLKPDEPFLWMKRGWMKEGSFKEGMQRK
jgi:hypothetical protein